MSVLEEERRSEVRGQRSENKGDTAPFPNPARTARNVGRPSRFGVYFTRSGWIHALLLMSVWLFLFPFFWMLSTSVKTDDELTESRLLPTFPRFRASSPYVRDPVTPQRPADV